MKKLFLMLIIALASCSFSNAQELGVRFGDISGGNAAIDAIFGLGKFSRVHADVSFGNSLGVDVLWDFACRPLGGEAFYWYAGVGPYAEFSDPFWFGVVGELGLEYRFKNVPITIGGDWRPGFSIIDETDFFAGGFGFNVRYRFGK